MSDFLKKFSDDQYNKQNEQADDGTNETDDTIKKDTEQEPQTKNKKNIKPNDTFDSTFATSNTKKEVFIRDDEKIQKRKKRLIIGGICALLICVAGFFGYMKLNEIRVPQFVGEKKLEEVQSWSTKNRITLDYTTKFSVKYDTGYITKQSAKKGDVIQKGSTLEVVVSKGANPDEHIAVPDFMEMSLTEIEKWKDDHKASNVIINKVFDETVEKAKTISIKYDVEGIDASNYRRKDKLTITVSKGKEEFEKNIEVPNFNKKLKSEVETWAQEKEVRLEFTEQASDDIAEGLVISQDVAPKTKIAKNDVLKVVISKGQVSFAPSFYGLDETQALVEAAKANVVINPVYYYSNSAPANTLISQSIPAGTEVKSQTIALVYSLGLPYIGNFDGEDIYSMVQNISEMNAKGAQLTYTIQEVSSTEKKGTIVTSSSKATFVNVGSRIVISVSKGS